MLSDKSFKCFICLSYLHFCCMDSGNIVFVPSCNKLLLLQILFGVLYIINLGIVLFIYAKTDTVSIYLPFFFLFYFFYAAEYKLGSLTQLSRQHIKSLQPRPYPGLTNFE